MQDTSDRLESMLARGEEIMSTLDAEAQWAARIVEVNRGLARCAEDNQRMLSTIGDLMLDWQARESKLESALKKLDDLYQAGRRGP